MKKKRKKSTFQELGESLSYFLYCGNRLTIKKLISIFNKIFKMLRFSIMNFRKSTKYNYIQRDIQQTVYSNVTQISALTKTLLELFINDFYITSSPTFVRQRLYLQLHHCFWKSNHSKQKLILGKCSVAINIWSLKLRHWKHNP